MNTTKHPQQKKKHGRQNANLIPLMEVARAMLSLSLEDQDSRMLDMDMSTTLAVSMASDNPSYPRRSVRVGMKENRMHIVYGIDHIQKIGAPFADPVDIAQLIYMYLNVGAVALADVAGYRE